MSGVINKYVQLHIQQVLSPAALRRQSQIGHTCIIVIHAQSQNQVCTMLNWTHRTSFMEMSSALMNSSRRTSYKPTIHYQRECRCTG